MFAVLRVLVCLHEHGFHCVQPFKANFCPSRALSTCWLANVQQIDQFEKRGGRLAKEVGVRVDPRRGWVAAKTPVPPLKDQNILAYKE